MPEPIELRLARLADAEDIARMSRDLIEQGLGWSWTPARVASQVCCADSVVLVASTGERPIGFAIMHFGEEEAHLSLLAVEPEYQGLGIGRRLIGWLEESARIAGTLVIHLEVRAGNHAGRAFYRKLGYTEIARFPGYYGGRETAVRMARDLCCADAGDREGFQVLGLEFLDAQIFVPKTAGEDPNRPLSD